MIYRADIHVLGAIRRATRLHWNADGAKEEVRGGKTRVFRHFRGRAGAAAAAETRKAQQYGADDG
jgi:hypothetical protein